MLKDYLNKGISTPIAIIIIAVLVALVGGFTWWQYSEIWEEGTEFLEVKLPEKNKNSDYNGKKDKTTIFLKEIEEETNIDFPEIEEIEFTWNDIQIKGKGFNKEITDGEYIEIKGLLLDKEFNIAITGDGTLAGSVLGFQKDQFVCGLYLKYQEIDFFACGELPKDYEEPKG